MSHRDELTARQWSEPAKAEFAPMTDVRLSPSGFEAFAQRVLRESGFQGVTVTGRSGDGGIDGLGILEVNPLVSFKVLFQCTRYAGSVGAGAVRAYRVDEAFFDEFA